MTTPPAACHSGRQPQTKLPARWLEFVADIERGRGRRPRPGESPLTQRNLERRETWPLAKPWQSAACCCVLLGAGWGADSAGGALLQVMDLGAGVSPQAINNLGDVAGQNAAGRAFRWSGGGMTDLGTVGGSASQALDINDSGVVVGWSLDGAGDQKAIRWTAGCGMENLDSSVVFESVAEAVNSHGDVVGWRTDGNFVSSTWWTEADVNGEFLFSGTTNHQALGIYDDAKIVGITLDAGGVPSQGFYWNGTDSTSAFSGALGDSFYPIAGVNDVDLSAGLASDKAAILQIGDADFTFLGKLSPTDTFSIANGLNDVGQIVGESDGKGFIFDLADLMMTDPNDYELLNTELGLFSIIRLLDINDAGQFVGVATIAGVEHGFIGWLTEEQAAFAIPEPSTLTSLAWALWPLTTWLSRTPRRRSPRRPLPARPAGA